MSHTTRLWKLRNPQHKLFDMVEEKQHEPAELAGRKFPASDVACRYAHRALHAGTADKVEIVAADKEDAEVFTLQLRNGQVVLV